MLIEHEGRRPPVARSAYVAPTAVVSGDVVVGEDCRVLFGAALTAEGDDFPGTVFGIERPESGEAILPEVSRGYAELFGRHGDDRIL